jgi:imidazolonepropionase-like amidohydrolase
VAALAALAVTGPAARAQTIAIVGGTVHPVSGPKIPNGTVLIRDGRIAAVGAEVDVPADAVRIDAAGKVVTPGLIHAASRLGVAQFSSGAVNETRDNARTGDINASFAVAEAIEPDAVTIPVVRLQGITTAIALPEGGLISGQAAAFDLAGNRLDEMLVQAPAALVIRLGLASKSAGGGSRAEALARIRVLFDDAREYDRRRDDYRKAGMQPLSASARELEALLPALRRELPVVMQANRRSDIEAAVRLAREYQLRLVILGGAEAWRLADHLARAQVPVLLDPLANVPTFDALAPRLDNAALLRKAGARVIIATGSDGTFGATLRNAAGNAVATGMAWTDALAAVTVWPAEALGLASRYGTLAPGKVANVVVWSGDPFEYSTKAERVFIRGVEVPRTSRQVELLEKYRR